MRPHRRRNLIASRRRLGDDEEEEDDAADDLGNDSQSEASWGSGAEEDGDADDSDLEEGRRAAPPDSKDVNLKTEIATGKVDETGSTEPDAVAAKSPPPAMIFSGTADTDAMMTGLKVSSDAEDNAAVDFEEPEHAPERSKSASAPIPKGPAMNGKPESFADKRKREHEEYKKERSSNPAFVPNRGGFFMHDQRSVPGLNGMGPFGRGRGRARGGAHMAMGNFGTGNGTVEITNGAWAHDLHDTINDIKSISVHPQNAAGTNLGPNNQVHKENPNAQLVLSSRTNPYSKTTQTGTVQLKIFLPNMKEPKILAGIPVKQHTRLPDLRPPLRRDKPVRISLPNLPPRYNFPKVERSFVFIPRAERPNQQSGRRSRPRGIFSQQGSRRTSVHGGSVYSPSISMSRRSSRVHSPAGSISSRPITGPVAIGHPVVRLPIATVKNEGPLIPSSSVVQSSSGELKMELEAQAQAYPLPQDPTYREYRTGNIPMHQPRPQKTVSVAGIESPSDQPFRVPQPQEQQPFHQQVPAHINGRPSSSQEQALYYPHTRQISYPSQGSGGTPLSNIPERAIHAQPFQPTMMAPPGYYPQMYPIQSMYYYPTPSGQQVYTNGAAPMFVPQAQQMPYMVPMLAAPSGGDDNGPVAPGTLGHDGTTYFFDPSQAGGIVDGLAPASYAVPGMGGMMTPSPDGYFYGQPPLQSGSYAPQEFVPSR